jgi:acetyl esterase
VKAVPLRPDVEALRRKWLAAGRRPVGELSVTEARAAERTELEQRGEPEPVADVVDGSLSGPAGPIPIRVYRPQSAHPLPALVYFFGGGWVLGSLDTGDRVCRRLANSTPCAVVAVSYRRAPEHRFPAAVEDCEAATRWVAEHGAELGVDPRRLAVGGPSAGGNLAAAVGRLAHEHGVPRLRLQFLVYPPLDHRADTASMRDTLDPVFFDRNDLAWCWSHYLPRDADGDNPLASPVRAPDFRGLPPALVITAELDPLRDQGELYAALLAAAGVPTEVVRFGGMVHGFYSMSGVLGAADQAQAVTAAALRRTLFCVRTRVSEMGRTDHYANQGEFSGAVFDGPPVAVA